MNIQQFGQYFSVTCHMWLPRDTYAWHWWSWDWLLLNQEGGGEGLREQWAKQI